jgi:hypothetical protein
MRQADHAQQRPLQLRHIDDKESRHIEGIAAEEIPDRQTEGAHPHGGQGD